MVASVFRQGWTRTKVRFGPLFPTSSRSAFGHFRPRPLCAHVGQSDAIQPFSRADIQTEGRLALSRGIRQARPRICSTNFSGRCCFHEGGDFLSRYAGSLRSVRVPHVSVSGDRNGFACHFGSCPKGCQRCARISNAPPDNIVSGAMGGCADWNRKPAENSYTPFEAEQLGIAITCLGGAETRAEARPLPLAAAAAVERRFSGMRACCPAARGGAEPALSLAAADERGRRHSCGIGRAGGGELGGAQT